VYIIPVSLSITTKLALPLDENVCIPFTSTKRVVELTPFTTKGFFSTLKKFGLVKSNSAIDFGFVGGV
jgi:hypothetical protein